jgi:hypothetical protein
MEAILRFKLPKEKEEFRIASKAGEHYSMLWEIKEEIRKNRKYDKTPEDCLLDIANIIGDFEDEV